MTAGILQRSVLTVFEEVSSVEKTLDVIYRNIHSGHGRRILYYESNKMIERLHPKIWVLTLIRFQFREAHYSQIRQNWHAASVACQQYINVLTAALYIIL